MPDLLSTLTVRQLTKIAWIALAAWVVFNRRPDGRLTSLARFFKAALTHRVAFMCIATGALAAFLLAVASQHLSLRTSSHDFGLMDEALAGESGGRFMHTEVFGYSLLGEHFYLLMAGLIPLRRLIDSPWVTIVAHALLLWAALFPLQALLRREKVAPWLTNFACLMYACHPIVARTLSYVFHPEAAYPVCVLALLWSLRERRWPAYALSLLATLAIKEDAAVYLVGFSAWIALAEKRPKLALITATVSLVWLGQALKVWMPGFGAPATGYRFIARWVEYGETPANIAAGMLTHPLPLLADLLGRQPVLCFAGLGFMTFLTRWGWLAFLLPWVINTTSVEPMQAGLGLYYGAPVLAFALPAALAGLKSPAFKALLAHKISPALALMVAALNVAHVELPRPFQDRARIVTALAAIPHGEPVRVQPCLYPIGGYWPDKRPLMPAARPEAGVRYVAILPDHHPWPFSTAELEALSHRLARSGWTDISSTAGLRLFASPSGAGRVKTGNGLD